jgi:diguanylate cyclase (GGDEF)-like protein
VPHRKPELTLSARLLIGVASRTEGWRPPTQWTVAFASLAAILLLDAASGAQVTLFFLYLLVVGLAGWTFGERKGLAFAALAALCGSILRHQEYLAHPQHAVGMATELWNGCTRLLTFSLVVILVGGMRSAIRLERWRASTDGLTGVLNKASFHERMTAAVEAARGTPRAFILCYMDLDGFKQVNDRHGHSTGDKILRIFAQAAVDAIRGGDLFARIGGDEFVALISIPATADGDHVAALVHRRISTILARTGLPVSCSMGALVATADELEPLEAAIQLADSLMYEVKHSGKNALRIGRIDPTKALTAPDRLIIRSDMEAFAKRTAGSAVIVADRRAA